MIKLKHITSTVSLLGIVFLFTFQAHVHGTVNWKKNLWIKDELKLKNYPEELVSYTLLFPENTVKKDHLKLTKQDHDQPLVYQLSDITEKNNFLTQATIHFRTGLDSDKTVRFILEHDDDYRPDFPNNLSISKHSDGTVSVTGNLQFIRVPFGEHNLNSPTPAQVMAPLLEIGRNPDNIAAKGSFQGPNKINFETLTGEVKETGPLFCKYQVTYYFADGGKYQVDLQLLHNESFVLINEYMSNLGNEKQIAFQLDYSEGVNPDGRLAYTMSGYKPLSGKYDKDLNSDGSLPLYVGLWDVHNRDVPYSVAYWNDKGKPSNAILFSQYRHDDWKADTHYIWNAEDAAVQLQFYKKKDRKYMEAQLAGNQRHWAVSVIPRNDVVIRGNSTREVVDRPVPEERSYKVYSDFANYGQGAYDFGNQIEFGSGPEVKLHQKLTYFSLNWIKDMVFEFREPLTKYQPDGKEYTYDEYWHEGEDQNSWYFKKTVKTIADMGLARTGRAQFRTGDVFTDYGNSRAGWTLEQRNHIRALLIWATHIEESDIMYPHKTLMGGHPNFIANAKYGMAYSCALFPEHPKAPEWKSEYMQFLDAFFEDYIRNGVPEMGIRKGRFMENPANYMPASLLRIYQGAEAIKKYDGTYLLSDERFRSWMTWMLHALMPYVYEGDAVMPSPIGAHAVVSRWDRVDNGEDHWGAAYETANFMHEHDDNLGSKILYVLTGGKEGMRPQLESHVWGDYGGLLHYAAGSDSQAFVHLFQRGSTMGYGNYRYPPHDAGGVIYYAAKGKTWSWNGAEKFGDAFNPDRLTLFRTRDGFLGGLETAGQHGKVYNFGDVQFYKAKGSSEGIKNGYLSRSVMMFRDDYIVVYDNLDNPEREGIFQWINEEDGLKQTVFSDTEFNEKVESKIVTDRFLTDREWNDGAPVSGMDSDEFSVRWEGAITSARGLTGDYTFSIELNDGSEDVVRLYIDNKLLLETTGKDAEVQYTLKDSTNHPFKLEYVHKKGEAEIEFRFSHPEDKNTTYQARGYSVIHTMPEIHSVKGKVNQWAHGDQVHVVAPANASLKTTPMEGGVMVEDAYVFLSDSPRDYDKNGIVFNGTSGYAAPDNIALFEGKKVGRDDLVLETVGGDFSASARKLTSEIITGRLSGASGGVLMLTVPVDFNISGKQVLIDNVPVPFDVNDQTYSIQVDVSSRDGYKTYRITNDAKTSNR